MNWIDIHTHLNMLEEPPEESVELALKNNVSHMITIGTCMKDLPVVLDLAESHSPHVFCTLGIHPHEAHEYNEDVVESYLRANLSHERVVAVGEIGLDYYYEHSPQEIQREVFRSQLRLAAEYGLPVEIHTRDAEEDTIEILKEFQSSVRGVLHCFTGSSNLARQALSLGYNISFSGVVTFKNADSLREIVKEVPLDRIHVETDAPFLTPHPFRGKKNSPFYMIHTAEKVAELKGVTMEQLMKSTTENALNLFPKLVLN